MKNNRQNKTFKELNSDQAKALAEFNCWLNKDSSSCPFVLSGYAGSGKTFLSVRFLKIVEDKKLCWTVAAPTHKAVGVLRAELNSQELRPTWYPSTIHRLLRLRLRRKGDKEECKETDLTANSLEKLSLVLIDEASMINSDLLEIILRCSNSSNTKLVFIGDSAQLPPVGEEISPVFSLKRGNNFQLKSVVRHQGPVLLLAQGLRDGSVPCVPPPCFPAVHNQKGLVASVDKKVWLEKAKSFLKNASLEDKPDQARILCYTNRMLEKLVPHARRAIHGDLADQLPVLPGEVLITRSAIMAPASLEGVENLEEPDMVVGSNCELIVHDVMPEKCNLLDFGIGKDIELNTPIIDTLNLKVVLNKSQLTIRLLPQVDSSSRQILDQTLKKLRNIAMDVDGNRSRLAWKNFFLIRDAFASLGPASVLTVHRSQGSTFESVFIAPDVFWPKDMKLRNQLVYVAISRASRGVWLIGDDKSNYNLGNWLDKLSDQNI